MPILSEHLISAPEGNAAQAGLECKLALGVHRARVLLPHLVPLARRNELEPGRTPVVSLRYSNHALAIVASNPIVSPLETLPVFQIFIVSAKSTMGKLGGCLSEHRGAVPLRGKRAGTETSWHGKS